MTLDNHINDIKNLIHETERACGREQGSVLLLAVSKQQTTESIKEAYRFGIHDFAENYYQEALEKINQLRELALCWHFIGPIQSNKAKGIALRFNWVHSIDRYKIAELLNHFRPSELPPLNICLQINLAGEQTKSGILPEKAEELAYLVNQLPRLRLKGLMTIPPIMNNEREQYEHFLQVSSLLHTLNQKLNLNMDTLSMGMTDDFVSAIKAGSTIVRIGRALFGERKGKNNES